MISPSPYVNATDTGNKTSSTTTAIDTTHPSIPSGTPQDLFKTERWDPSTAPEMQWNFPVTAGTYQVRLYFAEIYSGAQGVGLRKFDVSIENALILNDYDIFAEVGGYKAVMKSFTVTSDANLDIDFGHVIQNPKINGIEIVSATSTPNQLGASPSSLAFGQVVMGQTGTQALQLTNLGGAGSPDIVVDATAITGTNPGQFSDDFNDAGAVTLPPGGSTTVNVTFAPTSTGSKTATLEMTHSGSNSPLAVPLSGEGIADLPGSWQARAPSGPVRQEVSYVHLNGKFYLAGGSSGSTLTAAQEVYDPATDTWATAAPLPEALDHIQGVALNGKIYYLGGLEGWPGPASAQVYVYDPATGAFTQGAAMPRPRGAGGVAVYQGKIYYAGGLNQGSAVPWFDVYDPAANAWSQLPDMPAARDHFHAEVIGGRFYVTGGRNTAINATVTSTVAYDFSTGTWQTGLPPLPTARGGFASAVLGQELLVIGGEGGGKTFAAVEAYDTTTNTWRTLEPMPTARHGIQAATCNGGVYVAAGGKTQGGGTPTDVHEAFFLQGATTCASSTAPSTVAGDTFTRTVTDGWGTADTGGPWTVLAGSAANFDVNGTKGTVVTPSGSNQQMAHLGGVSLRDVDAQVAVTFPQAPSGSGSPFAYLLLRRQSGGAYDRVGLYVTSGGKVFIRGETETGADLFPDVDTGLSFAAGDTFLLRVQAQGTNPTAIRARAWKAGTAEPSTWAVSTTTTAGPQAAGSVGVRTVNTNATSTTIAFDDLEAKTL
jgi:N-acetylneuraminic acid mutarotase